MTAKRYRYRVRVFDDPRADWRETAQQAKEDAIRLGLASYDESERAYYLAVPVSIEREAIN